jgi:ribosomal protein L14
MIQKLTWLSIADNTNIRWVQVFHLYKGFHRKKTTLGFFVKGSARIVEPPRIVYKGFKFKFNRRGDICRSLIIRVNRVTPQLDGSTFLFPINNALIIKKKAELKSKYTFGPISSLLKRKRYKTLFSTIW